MLAASVVTLAVCVVVAVGVGLAVISYAGQERAGQEHADQGNAAHEDAAGAARLQPTPGPAGQGAAGPPTVVGDAPASRLVEIRRDADEALRYVRAVWDGPWADRVVVEVPAGGAGFRAASGRAGADGEAAVAVLPREARGPGASAAARALSGDGSGDATDGGTASPGCPPGGCAPGVSSGGTDSGIGGDGPGVGRVIVNPEVYDRLSVEGRQVVLRHEFTHLASADVTGAGTPTWLVEGLAETVGHAGVRLAVARAATELAAEVRAGRLPDALPDDAAFSATDGSVPVRYQESWLACRLIADRVGLDGMIRFYRQVGTDGGDPRTRLADALRAVLGVTEADFVTQWRSYLGELLHP
ncbi:MULTISPECIES: hypothetical protein [Protofrankia]|uniref:hypothetical protein n=1 Tax=Protofrankia TaxID=2994361 RepID=UPI00069A0E8A|nr:MULTISPECIES: hypothetical protein [Protofrankia]ONH37219.1 hypothetical protein BL254_03935 [Protofrankia sp. BMG5.30]